MPQYAFDEKAKKTYTLNGDKWEEVPTAYDDANKRFYHLVDNQWVTTDKLSGQTAPKAAPVKPIATPAAPIQETKPSKGLMMMAVPGIPGLTIPVKTGSTLRESLAGIATAPGLVASEAQRSLGSAMQMTGEMENLPKWTPEIVQKGFKAITSRNKPIREFGARKGAEIAKGAEADIAAMTPESGVAQGVQTVAKVPLEMGKYIAEGLVNPALPAADLAMTGMANRYRQERLAGQTPEQAVTPAMASGGVGAVVGNLPGGKQVPTLLQAGMRTLGRAGVVGTGLHAAESAITGINRPEEAIRELKDPSAYLKSAAMMLAYELPGITGRVSKGQPSLTPDTAKGERMPTIDEISSAMEIAQRNGDTESVAALKRAYDSMSGVPTGNAPSIAETRSALQVAKEKGFTEEVEPLQRHLDTLQEKAASELASLERQHAALSQKVALTKSKGASAKLEKLTAELEAKRAEVQSPETEKPVEPAPTPSEKIGGLLEPPVSTVDHEALRSRIHEEANAAIENKPETFTKYSEDPRTAGGKIINADVMAEVMSPSTASDPLNSHYHMNEHGGAHRLAKELFWSRMRETPGNPDEAVAITIGPPASGKSTFSEKNADTFHTIVDSSGSDPRTVQWLIDKARESGRTVDVVNVHAPTPELVSRNVGRQKVEQRAVAINDQAELIKAAPDSFLKTIEANADDPGVRFVDYDSSAKKAAFAEDARKAAQDQVKIHSENDPYKEAVGAYNKLLEDPNARPDDAARSVFESGNAPTAKEPAPGEAGRPEVLGGTRGAGEGEVPKSASLEGGQVEPSKPGLERPEPKVAPFFRSNIPEHAKGVVEAFTGVVKDTGRIIAGEANVNYRRLHELMNKAGLLQERYKPGSMRAPAPANSSINPYMPNISNAWADKPAGFVNEMLRSPHNVWEDAFGRDNPASNLVLAKAHRDKMAYEYNKFFSDTYKSNGIKDNSVAISEKMKPIFERYLDARTAVSNIDARKPPEKASPYEMAQWQKVKDATESAVDAVITEKNKTIKDLASNYTDARVALASEFEPKKYPEWLKLSPKEERAAAAIRDFSNKKVKPALEANGIKTLGDDDLYVMHMGSKLTDGYNTSTHDAIKSVLNFKSREENSSQWLPSAHVFAESYVPSATYKLAYQPFLNKWGTNGGAIDPSNANGIANRMSPNYSPGAAEYLRGVIHDMQNPARRDWMDYSTETLRNISNTVLLGANPRVGYKHLVGKATSEFAEQHAWVIPATKGQIQAGLANWARRSPAFKRTLDTLGLNKNGDWDIKADLIRHFVIPREVSNTFKDDPFKSEMSGKGVVTDTKGKEILADARKAWHIVKDNPVMAVEYWENGLEVMASMARAKGMDAHEAINAVMGNILDYNFRGGADAPGVIKSKLARAFVQFAQTPMKSSELKAKLVVNGLRGGKDAFGTDYTAKFVRQVVAYGAVIAAGKKIGLNVTDSLLHAGLINQRALHHLGKLAIAILTANSRDMQDRAAAIYGISEGGGVFPAAPWLGAPLIPVKMLAKGVIARGGIKERAKAALSEVPAFKQLSPYAGAKVPSPYKTPEQNVTGTLPESYDVGRDRREIAEGWKQWKKLRKKAK